MPIEQIAVGDQVYSFDEETGEEHPAEVVALHHRDVTELWLLQAGGETIETTDEHPFYVVGQGWTQAKDLQEGDVLIATSGNRLPLEKVERVEQAARVYNFEVRDLHTYLVGRVGAVVHNCAKTPVSAGEAGRFSDLDLRAVTGDKLTPHHMPQAAANFTSRAEGGALVLPEAEHILTRTYAARGAVTAKKEAGMRFRDVLARDLKDLRRIAGLKYNQGIRDLLQYYRLNFPALIEKAEP